MHKLKQKQQIYCTFSVVGLVPLINHVDASISGQQRSILRNSLLERPIKVGLSGIIVVQSFSILKELGSILTTLKIDPFLFPMRASQKSVCKQIEAISSGFKKTSGLSNSTTF